MAASTLEPFRGVFRDGWTDEDIQETLPQVSDAVGQRVVCVWEREDWWGCGGSSTLAVVVDGGKLAPVPVELWDYLVEAEGTAEAVLSAFPVSPDGSASLPSDADLPAHTEMLEVASAGAHNLVAAA